MRSTGQRVQRVEDKLEVDRYQPIVVEVDPTISREEAWARPGTVVDSGRQVIKMVIGGDDALLL